MKILLIDFYDSFTFNLKHYLECENRVVDVIRHDMIGEIEFLDSYSHIILSPGPGLPMEKTNMLEIISFCENRIPLLGVCLGMQAIGIYLGGTLKNMDNISHGVSKTLIVVNRDASLFQGLPKKMEVGLYHSWAIFDIGEDFIDARLADDCVMAISDPSRKLFGLQFHPESVLSQYGREMLNNFLNYNS